jgi:hypothetical protein
VSPNKTYIWAAIVAIAWIGSIVCFREARNIEPSPRLVPDNGYTYTSPTFMGLRYTAWILLLGPILFLAIMHMEHLKSGKMQETIDLIAYHLERRSTTSETACEKSCGTPAVIDSYPRSLVIRNMWLFMVAVILLFGFLIPFAIEDLSTIMSGTDNPSSLSNVSVIMYSLYALFLYLMILSILDWVLYKVTALAYAVIVWLALGTGFFLIRSSEVYRTTGTLTFNAMRNTGWALIEVTIAAILIVAIIRAPELEKVTTKLEGTTRSSMMMTIRGFGNNEYETTYNYGSDGDNDDDDDDNGDNDDGDAEEEGAVTVI